MCVIYSCTKGVPGEYLIKAGEECNPHGAGIAWTEGDKVRWVKGIDSDEVLRILRSQGVKPPLQIHFRVATVGGKCKELTHPFVLSSDPKHTIHTEGTSEWGTMMHNGHWSEWEEALSWAVIGYGMQMPEGPMSDSRALSIIVAKAGTAILDILPYGSGRVSILTPRGLMHWGGGWIDKEREGGFYQSQAVQCKGRVQDFTGWQNSRAALGYD